MKKLAITILFAAGIASAHGSVSKNVGNVVVNLNQNPLSPLVGEQVDSAFIFTDINFQPLANVSGQLKLTDTFFGDASRDQTVETLDFKTDENGSFVFSYDFPKTDYYDLELTFKDPKTSETETTGFLIQVRESRNNNWIELAAAGIIGILLGVIFIKVLK